MPAAPFDLPPGFLAHAARGERWAAWIADVPRLLRDLLEEWGLAVDGEPTHGETAVVVPVTTERTSAVLKVAWPHEEGRHEILGLQTWHGRGAVRMLRADPRRNAMVLERLGPRDLTSLPVLDACEVVAGLYADLHVAAPPQLVPLPRYVEEWMGALSLLPRRSPVPHRIVEQAVHLARGLVSDPASVGVLIHGDLHYGNVLAADRDPWLAIDPKPVSGDPHYEIAPLLSNRWGEVTSSGDVRTAVRRRFRTVVDVAGLDEDRARDWVIVREAVAAMWAIDEDDIDRVTTAVAIIKAVQD